VLGLLDARGPTNERWPSGTAHGCVASAPIPLKPTSD